MDLMILASFDKADRFVKKERENVNLKMTLNEPPHDKTNNKITVRPAKTQISLGIRPV